MMLTFAGYVAAGLTGVCLGLIGAGGSILTVPILVYLFQVDPTHATAYSLFIVGITALAGALKNTLDRQVDFPTVLLFGVPSLVGTFLSRRYLVTIVPDILVSTESATITRNMIIMILFALMMMAAGISMLRKQREQKVVVVDNLSTCIQGFIVGVLTGVVGAGGGFLIIPTLVLFAGLPMKLAVGTSLMVIATKSLFGFTGDMLSGMEIDYRLMGSVALVAVLGIFAGTFLGRHLVAQKLKRVFGWFVIVMSVFILTQQLFF